MLRILHEVKADANLESVTLDQNLTFAAGATAVKECDRIIIPEDLDDDDNDDLGSEEDFRIIEPKDTASVSKPRLVSLFSCTR
jgi:hypothetical protein